MDTVTDFIFLGSKITADGGCSHQIKRHLLLGRKAMTKLDRTLKSRDITLLTKDRLVKAMLFPVVRYGCESWIMKNTEHLRINAFNMLFRLVIAFLTRSKVSFNVVALSPSAMIWNFSDFWPRSSLNMMVLAQNRYIDQWKGTES